VRLRRRDDQQVIRRDRTRVLVGLALTLAIVLPLGWMWWDSRLPGSYSAMEMGELDFGGGPGGGHAHHSGAGMKPVAGGTSVSVADLDTKTDRKADVVVDLTAREGRVRLASGRTVEGYSLNNSSPGPLIEATVGELVEVRLHNESVKGGVALHWHGVDVPNAQDGVAGVTQDSVGVGEDHTYRWIAPDAGTYWYHSHQQSHEQVAGGLFGGVLIHPAQRDPDVRDVVTMTHLYDGKSTVDGESGTREVTAEPGEVVRVRVVNTDNGPQSAWSSVPFVLRAVDGFEINEPTPVEDESVGIPAGGRADLEVEVPQDGTPVRIGLLGGLGLSIGPEGRSAPKVEQPDSAVDLLGYGSARDVGFDPAEADRRFDYSIGRRPGFLDGRPGIWWSVNGKLYPDVPMFVVREDDVVRVRISNHSGEVHPMHLHGHHALVLSRDGKKATGSPWWFDSLDVQSGESYDVAFVADNPGVWMDHCHNLKHAVEGLVTHLMYEGVTTPYRIGDDTGNTPE
jgi:FtsP/CotA-like multicopper oxidase with cupredoxin domain